MSELSTFAKIADQSYKVNPQKNVNGYKLIAELSDDDTKVYRKGNDYVISSRGTSLKKDRIGNDLNQDLSIVLNTKKHNKLFKKRTKDIENIMRQIKESEPFSDISLTGHSLGGSISINALNNKYINDNTKRVITYNPGTTPTDFDKFKGDSNKITNNIIKGDPISQYQIPGNNIFFETKKDNPLSNLIPDGPFSDTLRGVFNKHSIDNFVNNNVSQETTKSKESSFETIKDISGVLRAIGELEKTGEKIQRAGFKLRTVGGVVKLTGKGEKIAEKITISGSKVIKGGKAVSKFGKFIKKAGPIGEAITLAQSSFEAGKLIDRTALGRKVLLEIIKSDPSDFYLEEFNKQPHLVRTERIQFFGGFIRKVNEIIHTKDINSNEYQIAKFYLDNPKIFWVKSSNFTDNLPTHVKVAQSFSPLTNILPIDNIVDTQFTSFVENESLSDLQKTIPKTISQEESDRIDADIAKRAKQREEDSLRLKELELLKKRLLKSEGKRISSLKSVVGVGNFSDVSFQRNHPDVIFSKNVLNIGLEASQKEQSKLESFYRRGIIRRPGTLF